MCVCQCHVEREYIKIGLGSIAFPNQEISSREVREVWGHWLSLKCFATGCNRDLVVLAMMQEEAAETQRMEDAKSLRRFAWLGSWSNYVVS